MSLASVLGALFLCPDACSALTWSLNGGSENWPADKRTAIINAMNDAVAIYNANGYFNLHLTANYNASVPTAQASYGGWIDFGGSISARVALHEISHTLGVGTYWNWDPKLTTPLPGAWTGSHATARVKLYNGASATINGDTNHFWPYGLNYDSEDGTTNRIRHVRLVSALRWDMGIVTDSDSDGLPDDWEQFWFDGLGQTGTGDFDKDGSNNLAEYNADTDPTTDFSFTWKGGAGTWDTATANWTGAATIWRNGGDDSATFGGTQGTVTHTAGVTVNDMAFNTTGYQIAGGTTLSLTGSDPSVTTATGVTATIDPVLSGSGGLIKKGAGTLILTGASTFTGPLSVEAGTLTLAGSGRLYMNGGSAGTTINSGGTLSFTGNWGWDGTMRYMGVTAAENVINGGTLQHTGAGNPKTNGGAGRLFTIGASGATLDSATAGQEFSIGYRYDYPDSLAGDGGTLYLTGEGDGDLNYRIPGSGGLVKRGSGTWKLTSAGNSYSGGTTIGVGNNAGTVGGILRIASSTALGTGAVTVIAGDPASTCQGAQLQLTGGITPANPTITTSGFGYGANNGVILNVSGNNSLTGTIQLSSGAGGSIIGSDSGTLTLSAVTAVTSTRTLEFTGAGGITAAGVISNGSTAALPLTKSGSGTLILSAANTYTGATSVNGGVVNIRNAVALGGTASGTTVADGARVELEGGITTAAEPIGLSGPGGTSYFYGSLNSKSGSNTWTGPVTILAPGTRIGTMSGATLTVSGAIGSGGLDHGLVVRPYDANSPVVLSGANTYGGATQVFGGTLKLDGGDNRLPFGTNLVLGASNVSGTLDLNGRNQQVAGLSIAQTSGTLGNAITNTSLTASVFTVNTTVANSFTGALTGNVSLVKSGAESLTLVGNHSLAGATSVSAGTLVLNGSLTASAVNVSSGGTLAGNGSAASVTVSPGGTLSPAGDGQGAFTTGALTLASGSNCRFQPGAAADRVNVSGNLVLGGTITLTDTGALKAGTYVLFTHTGSRSGNAVVVPPPGFSATLDTTTAGAVSVVLAANDFGTWQRTYFSALELANPAISGPDVVLAGDGLSNLMKYALGLPPKSPGLANLLLAKSSTAWQFTYQRPADRPDLTYAVEVSGGMGSGSWSSAGVTHVRITTGATETWRASVAESPGKLFFRLRVSRP